MAVIGMVGLFATAIIYQRANKLTHTYYKGTKVTDDNRSEPN